jgi:REP element-mobilizing transposase RayT
MKYNPEIHHRRSIRLKGYDYTQPAAYFVTICTYQRMHVFGEIVNGEMVLNDTGKIARDEWFKTAELRPSVKLYEDEFVIMPNHGHGIIWIVDDDHPVGALPRNAQLRAEQRSAPTKNVVPRSLGAIVRAYKSAVTYAVNAAQQQRGAVLWQRNYYDHIIRDDHELNNIRWYIVKNPLNWLLDHDNAQNLRKLSFPETVEEYVKDVENTVLKSRLDN